MEAGRVCLVPTILLVEVELAVLCLYRHILESGDFSVFGVGTAAEASEICQQVKPDLLIADNGLPDGDGLDLLLRLRTAGTPTILTSGALSPGLIAAAKYWGVEPVDKLTGPNQLVRTVQRLVGAVQRAPK